MPWKHLIKLLKAARGRLALPLTQFRLFFGAHTYTPCGLSLGSTLSAVRPSTRWLDGRQSIELQSTHFGAPWLRVCVTICHCCDTCAPFGDPFVPHSLVVHCARVACSRFQRVYLVAIYLLLLTSGFKSSLLTGIAGILLCHYVRLLPFDNAISFLGVSKAIDQHSNLYTNYSSGIAQIRRHWPCTSQEAKFKSKSRLNHRHCHCQVQAGDRGVKVRVVPANWECIASVLHTDLCHSHYLSQLRLYRHNSLNCFHSIHIVLLEKKD